MAGIQSGRKSYSLRPVALRAIVEAALRNSQTALEQAGFEVAVDVAADLPEVAADEEALRRALENLISNAVKYAREGAWLGVEVRQADQRAGAGVEIEIRDRGPGIPEADQQRVFEPFVRGKNQVASNLPGTGLGLSLVQQIVEAHGGDVCLESREGEGCTFVLSLPPLPAHSEPGEEA